MSNEKNVTYDPTMDPNSLPIVNVDEHSSTENVDLDKKHPFDEKDPEKHLHSRTAVEDVDVDDQALVREAEELEARLAGELLLLRFRVRREERSSSCPFGFVF